MVLFRSGPSRGRQNQTDRKIEISGRRILGGQAYYSPIASPSTLRGIVGITTISNKTSYAADPHRPEAMLLSQSALPGTPGRLGTNSSQAPCCPAGPGHSGDSRWIQCTTSGCVFLLDPLSACLCFPFRDACAGTLSRLSPSVSSAWFSDPWRSAVSCLAVPVRTR